jgi:hypothetical protein
LTFVLPLFVAATGYGSAILDDECSALFSKAGGSRQNVSVQMAVDSLQAAKLLVQTGTIPGYEDTLCGFICSINAVQVASLIAGRKPLRDPQHALELFVKNRLPHTKAKDGGLSNHEIIDGLKVLFSAAFKTRHPKINGKFLQGTSTDLTSDMSDVASISKSDTFSEPDRIKILVIGNLNPDGSLNHFHATIVKYSDRDKLETIDPVAPNITLIGTNSIQERVDNGYAPRYSYSGQIKPRDFPSFVVLGVITIDMRDVL